MQIQREKVGHTTLPGRVMEIIDSRCVQIVGKRPFQFYANVNSSYDQYSKETLDGQLTTAIYTFT